VLKPTRSFSPIKRRFISQSGFLLPPPSALLKLAPAKLRLKHLHHSLLLHAMALRISLAAAMSGNRYLTKEEQERKQRTG